MTYLANNQADLLVLINKIQKRDVHQIIQETIDGVNNYLEFVTLWPEICRQVSIKGTEWVEIS